MPPFTVTWNYGTSSTCSADLTTAATHNAGGSQGDSIVVPADLSNPQYPANTPGVYYYCATVSDAFGSTVSTTTATELDVNNPLSFGSMSYASGVSAADQPVPLPYGMTGEAQLVQPQQSGIFSFPGGNVLAVVQPNYQLSMGMAWSGGTPPYNVTLVSTPPQSGAGGTLVSSAGSAPCGSEVDSSGKLLNALEQLMSKGGPGNNQEYYVVSSPPVGGVVTQTTLSTDNHNRVDKFTTAADAKYTYGMGGTISKSAQVCAYVSDSTGMVVNSINYGSPDWNSYFYVDVTQPAPASSLPINVQQSKANASAPTAVEGHAQPNTTMSNIDTTTSQSYDGAYANLSVTQVDAAQPNASAYAALPGQQVSAAAFTTPAGPDTPSSDPPPSWPPCDATDPNTGAACTQWINEWEGYWYNLTVDQSGNLYVVGAMTLSQQKSTFWGIWSSFNKYAAPTPKAASTPAPTAPQATCPDSDFQGSTVVLTLPQVEACAQNAGFSTPSQIDQIVSMAFQESSFIPGTHGAGISTCTVGQYAEGILQEGKCGVANEAYPLSNYDPTTCSAYASNGWSGVYYDPACAFKWAYAFTQDSIGSASCQPYCFWGAYISGAYCKYAPTSYSGYDCPQGGGDLQSTPRQLRRPSPQAPEAVACSTSCPPQLPRMTQATCSWSARAAVARRCSA